MKKSDPVMTLLAQYRSSQNHDPTADRIADDIDAVDWLRDYWDYTEYLEHGNGAGIGDLDGFADLCRLFTFDAQNTYNYLMYDDYDELDRAEQNLVDRFLILANRYGGVVNKMKKMETWEMDDHFDELPSDFKNAVRSLCMTLQVSDPVIDKRGEDYYFVFSYYDGDPEHYFDSLNIQQDSANRLNYLNLTALMKNPPAWMRKMKKSNEYGFPDRLNVDGLILEGRDMGLSMRYESDWNSTSLDKPKMVVELSNYMGSIMVQYSILKDNEVLFSDYTKTESVDDVEWVVRSFNALYGDYMNKMKKSLGRYGTVEQVHDMSDDVRRLYEYKVKENFNDVGYIYIWWRIFEKDGVYSLKRLEGNGFEGIERELSDVHFGTLDEAVAYADKLTDRIRAGMYSLYGHGMDASWSDNDIDTYNNFGDSIKSTKKSTPSIHDMIAQTRQNNNSLTKSRVDLDISKYQLRSVGPNYDLDVNRIAEEMFQIYLKMIEEGADDDSGWIEPRAFDKWEEDNYHIDYTDEYGDVDYHPEIYSLLEDKVIDYRKKQERALMDKVYDLEYNDLVSFKGYGKYYVKSTNGNDSYLGCKIWAGPDKDNEMGWYFYASDFDGVVEPSYSGEHLFG